MTTPTYLFHDGHCKFLMWNAVLDGAHVVAAVICEVEVNAIQNIFLAHEKKQSSIRINMFGQFLMAMICRRPHHL